MNEKNDNFSFLTEFQSDNFNARSKLKVQISQDFQTLSMEEMYGQEGNAPSWNWNIFWIKKKIASILVSKNIFSK